VLLNFNVLVLKEGMKKSVYIDSTIPSYYFDKREDLRFPSSITRDWWKLEFVKTIERLEPSPEIGEIVKYYIGHSLMPQDVRGDAVHLAYASFYKIDFLLTWNCNHLANANKKQHIRIINARLDLFTPEIITPLELFTEK